MSKKSNMYSDLKNSYDQFTKRKNKPKDLPKEPQFAQNVEISKKGMVKFGLPKPIAEKK